MADLDRMMRQAAMTAHDWTIKALESIEKLGMSDWSSEAKATYIAGFIQAAGLDQLAVASVENSEAISYEIRTGVSNILEKD